MITIVPIGENHCAPDGAKSINLYDCDGGKNLTFEQLASMICMQAAAHYEARSISKLNQMLKGNAYLEQSSVYLGQLGSGQVEDWLSMKDYLANELGIPAADLPEKVEAYNDRMKAAKLLKNKMEALSRQAQEDLIDVQALLSRRDMTFSTGSNLINATGTMKMTTVNNY
ncbi:MAG: hypothetical protein MJ202_09585 [Lentisphaeria bacterium]|nr:hypothetical protein [Lentisphaeria bacterium]